VIVLVTKAILIEADLFLHDRLIDTRAEEVGDEARAPHGGPRRRVGPTIGPFIWREDLTATRCKALVGLRDGSASRSCGTEQGRLFGQEEAGTRSIGAVRSGLAGLTRRSTSSRRSRENRKAEGGRIRHADS